MGAFIDDYRSNELKRSDRAEKRLIRWEIKQLLDIRIKYYGRYPD